MTALQPYFRTWRDFLRGEATELVNENHLFPYRRNQHRLQGLSQRSGGLEHCRRCQAKRHAVRGGGAGVRGHRQPLHSGETAAAEGLRRLESGAAPAVRRVPLSGTSPRRRGTGSAGRVGAAERAGGTTQLHGSWKPLWCCPVLCRLPFGKGRSWGMPRSIRGYTLLYETDVAAADAVPVRDFWDALYQITVKMLKM